MGKVSYSRKGEPSVEQLLNTNINITTLAAGDGLIWDATNEVWVNGAGGGGGGVVGNDDQVLFKQGGVGNTFTSGISRDATAPLMTMNLNTTNRYVGVNKQNPTTTLDVGGVADFTDNSQTIKISEELIGLTTGTNELKLYSGNLPAVVDGLTSVDSVNKKVSSSALRSLDPTNFDVANSSDLDSVYKIKLQDGTTRQSVASAAFDIQEAFRPQAFPTGQIVEYQNKVPLQKPIIISRNLGPQVVAPATTRVITSFGSRRNAPFFDDGMIYDPCNMRAKLTGTGWNSAGAPVEYRVADLKLGFTISWNIHGTWLGPGTPLNRGDIYVNQYSNGVIKYNHLVQQLEQETESWWIGKKTFLGWDATAFEDFDPTTDYYEVELSNLAGVDLQYNSAFVEIECFLAQ